MKYPFLIVAVPSSGSFFLVTPAIIAAKLPFYNGIRKVSGPGRIRKQTIFPFRDTI